MNFTFERLITFSQEDNDEHKTNGHNDTIKSLQGTIGKHNHLGTFPSYRYEDTGNEKWLEHEVRIKNGVHPNTIKTRIENAGWKLDTDPHSEWSNFYSHPNHPYTKITHQPQNDRGQPHMLHVTSGHDIKNGSVMHEDEEGEEWKNK